MDDYGFATPDGWPGFKYLVVGREKYGRFMAPRQSRATTPEAAIASTVKNIASDRESWDDVNLFLVFDLSDGTEYVKIVEVEEIETVTYKEA